MAIRDEYLRLKQYDAYHESVLELRHVTRDAYTRAGRIEEILNALQAQVQAWSTAEEGTVERELYETHIGLFPANLNSYLGALRTAAQNLQTAVENADTASGGEWFGVT